MVADDLNCTGVLASATTNAEAFAYAHGCQGELTPIQRAHASAFPQIAIRRIASVFSESRHSREDRSRHAKWLARRTRDRSPALKFEATPVHLCQ